MPVGLPPAVSSVPKTPANCRPKGEGAAAGGERHPYLNLFSSLAGPHEMVTPEALHKWGKTKRRRGHVRARRSRGVQHGGKGCRRRVGETRHHHCRHRIRRCSQTPHRRRTGQDVRAGDGLAHRQARMLGLYGVDLGYATSPTAVPLHDLGINFVISAKDAVPERMLMPDQRRGRSTPRRSS